MKMYLSQQTYKGSAMRWTHILHIVKKCAECLAGSTASSLSSLIVLTSILLHLKVQDLLSKFRIVLLILNNALLSCLVNTVID